MMMVRVKRVKNRRKIGLLKKRVNLLEAENQQLKQIEAKRKVSTKAQLIPFFGELLEVTK